MVLLIDTTTGNKEPSPKLKQMLLDFKSYTGAWFDSIKEIRKQADKEGFNEEQTNLLLKQYLGDFLKKRQVRWILYEKPRRLEQKKLREKLATSGIDANMPMTESKPKTVNLPNDYNVIIPEEVIEEETKQLQQQQQEGAKPVNEISEEPKPNYETENLKVQLDMANNKITELTTQNKNWEEKYKQLQAKARVLPTNNFPVLQGNTLKTRIVVNPLFREVIQLKGSKVIYANIVIDISQNKYVRLEPL